ncbi:MAG: hypothetical protein H7Y08_10885 [Rhizobiaceae bacterium]|nr:hypothetical protein [Rhizobiaceae bacterium]
MALTSEFYRTRADECAREAEASSLANVRDRSRRAEAAWRAMADQSVQREAERDALSAEKASKTAMLDTESADRQLAGADAA